MISIKNFWWGELPCQHRHRSLGSANYVILAHKKNLSFVKFVHQKKFKLLCCDISHVNAFDENKGSWHVHKSTSFYGVPPISQKKCQTGTITYEDEIILQLLFNHLESRRVGQKVRSMVKQVIGLFLHLHSQFCRLISHSDIWHGTPIIDLWVDMRGRKPTMESHINLWMKLPTPDILFQVPSLSKHSFGEKFN